MTKSSSLRLGVLENFYKMGIPEAIKNFNKQFEFEPEIMNGEGLRRFDKFIAAGMGGSGLVAGLLKVWRPYLDIISHKNYGLPTVSEEDLKSRLIVANSHSGNTEETLSAFDAALERKLPLAAVSVGGKLAEMAHQYKIPYVALPEAGIQPRMAVGFQLKAFLKLTGEEEALREVSALSDTLHPEEYEEEGKELARNLKGRVPVIYSSEKNGPIAYNWKIKFNETGKIPAFMNVFPELNHNEMTGFDPVRSRAHGAPATSNGAKLNEPFSFIFLKDPEDHPRILKRMEVLEGLYRERGLPVKVVELKGNDVFNKIFSSLILADWAAYYSAEQYGLEAEQVPMVEEFKRLIT